MKHLSCSVIETFPLFLCFFCFLAEKKNESHLEALVRDHSFLIFFSFLLVGRVS